MTMMFTCEIVSTANKSVILQRNKPQLKFVGEPTERHAFDEIKVAINSDQNHIPILFAHKFT